MQAPVFCRHRSARPKKKKWIFFLFFAVLVYVIVCLVVHACAPSFLVSFLFCFNMRASILIASENYLLRLCLYGFQPKKRKRQNPTLFVYVWKQTNIHHDEYDDDAILKSLVSKICCIVLQLLIIRYYSISFHFHSCLCLSVGSPQTSLLLGTPMLLFVVVGDDGVSVF